MNKRESVIAFLPARCGSKSIRFKNIKEFCGKPLIYWNLKELSEVALIDEIYLATDCDEISDLARSFNIKNLTIYTRDKLNAQDTSSTESVILEFLEKNNFSLDTIMFLVQATSPFTVSKDFINAFNLYKDLNADSLLTCARIKKFFWREDGIPINYDYSNRPRRQDFKGDLVENGAFYINKIKNILKYQNRLSGKISIYEMPEYTSIEIDEEYDWIIAENIMKKYIIK
jgi:CMP-N-acetylneuraminic acid synthetase